MNGPVEERLRQRAAEEAKAAQASTPAVEPRYTFPQWLRDMAIICAVVFGVLGLAGLIVSTATNTARAAVKESRLDYYPVWWRAYSSCKDVLPINKLSDYVTNHKFCSQIASEAVERFIQAEKDVRR
jgi:hypothetical protein